MNSRKRLRLAVILFVVVFAFGVGGFKIFGGKEWSFLDSVYMTVITVATIGYGEVHDLSGNPPAADLRDRLYPPQPGDDRLRRDVHHGLRRRGGAQEHPGEKEDGKRDRPAQGPLHRLRRRRDRARPSSASFIRRRARSSSSSPPRRRSTGSWPPIRSSISRATRPRTRSSIKAGLAKAKGVLLSLPTDEANLFVTVTVRSLNPGIRIVAKGIDVHSHAKMRRAGADYVVSPTFIGGMRMVSQMVRPAVVTFLDTMLRDKEKGLRVEEIAVAKGSALAGKTRRRVAAPGTDAGPPRRRQKGRDGRL